MYCVIKGAIQMNMNLNFKKFNLFINVKLHFFKFRETYGVQNILWSFIINLSGNVYIFRAFKK